VVKIKITVLSLGGSLIVPDKVDTHFLIKFKEYILSYVKQENKVGILCGGGKTCRNYIQAAQDVSTIPQVDLDWIGIMATRLNAELVRTIFGEYAYEKVVVNHSASIKTSKRIIIGAGWEPGCTTDTDSVLFAETIHATTVINLTNIDYVYTKDPHKFKDAQIIKKISWADFRKIIGDKYTSGMNVPFDPVASKKAEQLKLKVIILNGNNIDNLKNCLDGKEYIGTVIG
jgi:uridylate kinase